MVERKGENEVRRNVTLGKALRAQSMNFNDLKIDAFRVIMTGATDT